MKVRDMFAAWHEGAEQSPVGGFFGRDILDREVIAVDPPPLGGVVAMARMSGRIVDFSGPAVEWREMPGRRAVSAGGNRLRF